MPAIVIAAVITFSADHSVSLGLALFASFAATTGIIVAVGGVAAQRSPMGRMLSLGYGVIGVGSAVIATGLAVASPQPTVGSLVALIAVYAAISGSLELYSGVRTRRVFAANRDWLFIGGITVLLSISLLTIPLGLRIPIKGQHGVEGFLTAPIVAVGLFGAYCAIIAVYLVIAGLSLKWAPTTTAAVAAERVN